MRLPWLPLQCQWTKTFIHPQTCGEMFFSWLDLSASIYFEAGGVVVKVTRHTVYALNAADDGKCS